MFDFDLLTLPIGLIIILLICVFLKYYYKATNVYLLFFSVFSLYILYVLKYTTFPTPVSPQLLENLRLNTNIINEINIIPLQFSTYDVFFEKQIMLNIVLSIPFGFGISYVYRVKRRRALIVLGLAFGTIIECMQLLISALLRIHFREVDINDIIFNFIGVLTGYFLYIIFSWIVLFVVGRIKYELNPILGYIYKVSKESRLKNDT